MRIQSLFVKGLACVLISAAAVSTGLAAATLNGPSDNSEIRAGYEIAVTTCVACHVVSSDQSIQPIEGRTSSSFREIANRPNVTLDLLARPTKRCSESTTLYPHCEPFDLISDREWRQVAAYILVYGHRRDAKELLEDSGRELADIARLCGFVAKVTSRELFPMEHRTVCDERVPSSQNSRNAFE